MSKHETAMTEGFWLSRAPGLFFAEYPLVIRDVDRATRLVDGLIFPDEPHDSWQLAGLCLTRWQTGDRHSNKNWSYGNLSDEPSTLFLSFSNHSNYKTRPVATP